MNNALGARIDRLPAWLRLLALAMTFLLLVFALGVVAGVAAASIENGELRPRASAAAVAALLAAALLSWFAWRLSAHWRRPGRSSYERRYTRMWLIVIALGFPIGIALGVIGREGNPAAPDIFSNGPLDPITALVVAAALAVILVVTLLLYHRTIDDHERQAYLWANSIAFYFLAISLPVAWLLARGGLIPAVGIGTTMLLLLASCLLQTVVWSWLKFR